MRREAELAVEAPIRVAQLTKSLWIGGTEVQTVELLRALPSRYQVQLALLEADGALLETVQQLGFEPTAFPIGDSLARAATLRQVNRLAGWLRQQRIQVLHAQDFYSAAIAVPAARWAGCKVVVSRLDLAHHLGHAKRLLWSQLSRAADHVVANADAIRMMLTERERLPAARVSVIRNGIDLTRFDARLREPPVLPLPDTGDARWVVHVANMNHPVKRQEDLLEAIAMLRRRRPDVHVLLVGDGPRSLDLQQRAAELGLAGAAHFLSYRVDVPAIYARAAVAVNCSWSEGLSNAVIEAMAARVPAVVTNVGGNPELIAHGERGLVVPAGRPELLASAISVLLDDRERARQLAARARTFVERHLNLTRMGRAHDALYRRLVGAV